MKKMLLSPAAAFALATCLVFSCKPKDKDPTKTELLTGTWTSEFDAEDGNGNRTLDAGEKIPATGTDIYTYVFNADGTGTISGGGLAAPLSYSWNFLNNETEIRMVTAVFGADTSKIHTLTATQAVTQFEESGTMYWNGMKK